MASRKQQSHPHPRKTKRPGAAVISSRSDPWETADKVQKLLVSARSRDRERIKGKVESGGLDSGTNKGNEDDITSLRTKLCEAFSDLLSRYPARSAAEDVHNRLWRCCFYDELYELRRRIQKEKVKAKKKSGSSFSNPDDSYSISARALQSLEQSHKTLLEQGIKFFGYFIEQYEGKLVVAVTAHTPGTQNKYYSSKDNREDSPPQDPDQTMSQSALESAYSFHSTETWNEQVPQDPDNLAGVVQGLHRFYIYIGDLQRYATSYATAESFYLRAAKLAPGMGNPYNQLAVIAQLKESPMPCLALYWYVRSIKATHDSFVTTPDNILRLFQTNYNYISRTLDRVESSERLLTSRSAKTSAIKLCLAQFVNIQFAIAKARSQQSTQSGKMKSLEEQIVSWCSDLQSLLSAAALGDSLLCKMIAILAHSIEEVQSDDQNKDTSSEDTSSALETSIGFLVLIGTQFAKRLVHGLKRSSTSTRCLLPLLLMCEYWEYIQFSDTGRLTKKENRLWSILVEVANLLPRSSVADIVSDDRGAGPVEFNSFKGFRPFKFLHKSYCDGDPFVSHLEAVDVLGLSILPSQSQSTQPDQSSELNIRTTRFLYFMNRAKKDRASPVVADVTGRFRIISEDEPMLTGAPVSQQYGRNPHSQDQQSTCIFGRQQPSEPKLSSPVHKPATVLETETGLFNKQNGSEDVDMGVSDGTDCGINPTVRYSLTKTGGPRLLVPGTLIPANGIATNLSSSREEKDAESPFQDIPPNFQESELSPVIPIGSPADMSKRALPPPPGFEPPISSRDDSFSSANMNATFAPRMPQVFPPLAVNFGDSSKSNRTGNMSLPGAAAVDQSHLMDSRSAVVTHPTNIQTNMQYRHRYWHHAHFNQERLSQPVSHQHSEECAAQALPASPWSYPPPPTANPFADSSTDQSNHLFHPQGPLSDRNFSNESTSGSSFLDSRLLNSIWMGGDKTLNTGNPYFR